MFKDYFSGHADDYAKYRPSYPRDLFVYLANLVPEHNLAWDCATGNGQAALLLAQFFKHVIATDASKAQIAQAVVRDNVHYRVATAENSGLDDRSVNLICVAQALHWFNFEQFFAECSRVLMLDGVVACFGYGLLQTENQQLDSLIRQFYHDIVGTYWPPERKYIEDQYTSIEFPFDKILMPEFQIETHWTLTELTAYLQTWSAVKLYQKQNQQNPVTDWVEHRLRQANLDFSVRYRFTFQLFFLVGRNQLV